MKHFTFFILIGLLLLTSCQPNNYGQKFKSEKFEVYFTDGVSEDQVKKLHEFFANNNLLNGEKQSVQISKIDQKFVLKLVETKDVAQPLMTPEQRSKLQQLADQISKAVFEGSYCELHIATNTFTTKEIIS